MTKRLNNRTKILSIVLLILFTIFLFSVITTANKQRQVNKIIKIQQEQIKEYRAKNGITKRGVDEFSREMRILHQQKKL